MKRELVFSANNLNKVFPFHLVLTREGRIESMGNSLLKMIPNLREGVPFEDEFEWEQAAESLGESWKERMGKILVFRHRSQASLAFKGHFEAFDGGERYAFFGNPALSSMDHLESLGLGLADLAPSDSLEDLLQVLKTNEIVTQKLTGLLQQVTDQRKALAQEKQNLQRSNDQLSLFRSLINSSSDAVQVVREDGSLYYINQTAADRRGIEQELVESGENPEFLHEKDWQEHLAHLESVDFLTLEDKTLHQSQGVEIDVEITSKLIHIAGEGYIVSFSRDISERKLAAQQLEEALGHAQEASEAKEAFLANMSHEIRTPLNGMMGMVRELRKMELLGRPGEYVFRTEKAVRHMYSLVNNVLDISRIEAGELELERTCFALDELLHDVEAMFKSEAEARKLALEVRSSVEMPHVYWGDLGRLRQVLINLAGNAIKFTREGHVHISAMAVERKGNKQALRLSVSDTGIGMSSDHQEKMFQKFQQEEAGTARKYGGSGLGLFIARELIQLMGGRINVHSVLGKGTRMEVELELEVGATSDLPRAELLDIPQGIEEARILLVEDNPMNRLVAVNALKVLGAVVTEVQNGQEAIDRLKEQEFELVFMDLQMPVLGGIEATRIIREEMELEVPIVALSANAFKSEMEQCQRIGMNGYVTKPYEEMDLVQVAIDLIKLPKARVPGSTNHFDLVKLRKMGKGNEAFVTKMLGIFVSMIPPSLLELEQACQSGDFATLRKLAHQLKPSIDNMGIGSLYHEIRQLEKATEPTHDLLLVLQRVKKVLQEAVEQVEAVLASRK